MQLFHKVCSGHTCSLRSRTGHVRPPIRISRSATGKVICFLELCSPPAGAAIACCALEAQLHDTFLARRPRALHGCRSQAFFATRDEMINHGCYVHLSVALPDPRSAPLLHEHGSSFLLFYRSSRKPGLFAGTKVIRKPLRRVYDSIEKLNLRFSFALVLG